MTSNNTAPIVLFVYNRPDHTKTTLLHLSKNNLAKSSRLIIYSDGPKDTESAMQVADVRVICKNFISYFSNFELIESKTNKGLACSIIEGVSAVVKKYDRVIVLEDDLITSPHFLDYMNNALDKYSEISKVAHISGASYPIKTNDLPETYFLKIPLCWGWATWSRAWEHFSKDIEIIEKFSPEMRHDFCFKSSHPNYWEQLLLNKTGKINTWFIFWYTTVFLNDWLCLFPKYSLVENIGFDGSGIHCAASNEYKTQAYQSFVNIDTSLPLEVSKIAYQHHVDFFQQSPPSKWRQIITKIKNKFNRII